jgi:hypothetical protein
MRIGAVFLLAAGCAAPRAPAPSVATEGPSGLLRVVLMLDKLK